MPKNAAFSMDVFGNFVIGLTTRSGAKEKQNYCGLL